MHAGQQPKIKFNLRKVRLNRGGYDARGQYFGAGPKLFSYDAEWQEGDFFHCAGDYIRARDRDEAKQKIRKEYPTARFFR